MRALKVPFLACALALASCESVQLEPSEARAADRTASQLDGNCTATLGYWRQAGHDWPVTELELGGVTYDAEELAAIAREPAGNDPWMALAHQLLAAKLNLAHGAQPTAVLGAMATADGLIGERTLPPFGETDDAPREVRPLILVLDAFNHGQLGVLPCENAVAPAPVCGDGLIDLGERCDDGNAELGDGCAPTCVIELQDAYGA